MPSSTHSAITSLYSHDATANLVRGGTSIIAVQLSCLWWGTIWQAASSRIANHSIALPVLSTSATPNNHYLPHLCSAPCELHTEHHHRESALHSQLREKQSSSSRPRSSGSHSDSWLRALEEQERNIDWRWWCREKRRDTECAWQNKKLSTMTMTYMWLYTGGKLADIHTHTHHTAHYQFRAKMQKKQPVEPLGEVTSYKLTFMAGGAKLFSPVAPSQRPECTERSGEDATWKPISCVIHQKTKPQPGGRRWPAKSQLNQ